jgi:hypothetical protein
MHDALSDRRSAGRNDSLIPESARIGVSWFGTSDQVAVEFLFASQAEMDSTLSRAAASTPAWLQDIHPLLKSGDTLESWNIVD